MRKQKLNATVTPSITHIFEFTSSDTDEDGSGAASNEGYKCLLFVPTSKGVR